MNSKSISFKDHFSGHAGDYATFRPTYPAALFDWLSDASPDLSLAWDCATGNGQAARALAVHFSQVIATDASARQVEKAVAHPRVDYRVETAENSSLATGSAALVVVAQAYHWFDHCGFLAEVDRVLKPGGLLAIWTYPLVSIEPDIDALVVELYDEVLGDCWPPERVFVDREYRDYELPWRPVEAPEISMTVDWSLDQLIGYLGTWSAAQRYTAMHKANPLSHIQPALKQAWGDPHRLKTAHWPVILKACRKPA